VNRLNRKVEYALIALKHMRSKAPGELTNVKEITTQFGCPFDATSRVLQVLAQKEVLRSEQGAHGGYQILRDLNRVSFFDLLEMITGPIALSRCLETDSESPCDIHETCNIISPMQSLNRKMNEFYKSLSLAEILEPRQSASGGRAIVTGLAASARGSLLDPALAVSGLANKPRNE
jgi:Rrf2 family nitric oxide-sensitive transcriptional repressor